MGKWYQLKEFPEHRITMDGKIKNLRTGNTLTSHPDKDGYFKVVIWYNKKRINRIVHRLIAQTFIPNPNNYPQINHKDGNKQNNSIDNLEWCDNSHNMTHAYLNGLNEGRPGIKHHNCKLTEEDVREIRRLHPILGTTKLLKKYNVHRVQLNRIVRGERWKHIK